MPPEALPLFAALLELVSGGGSVGFTSERACVEEASPDGRPAGRQEPAEQESGSDVEGIRAVRVRLRNGITLRAGVID